MYNLLQQRNKKIEKSDEDVILYSYRNSFERAFEFNESSRTSNMWLALQLYT